MSPMGPGFSRDEVTRLYCSRHRGAYCKCNTAITGRSSIRRLPRLKWTAGLRRRQVPALEKSSSHDIEVVFDRRSITRTRHPCCRFNRDRARSRAGSSYRLFADHMRTANHRMIMSSKSPPGGIHIPERAAAVSFTIPRRPVRGDGLGVSSISIPARGDGCTAVTAQGRLHPGKSSRLYSRPRCHRPSLQGGSTLRGRAARSEGCYPCSGRGTRYQFL